MSRIGKKVINIPAKTKVDVKDNVVTATGALGTLSYTVPADIKINIENGVMTLSIDESRAKELNAIHGTTRANVFNIIEGVTNGFHKNLEINGLGYRASVAGNKLTLELGFSHPVVVEVPAGITVVADPKSNLVEIKGSNKFAVGDFAAKIRRIRPPEPYKGSGIKYQGEHITRKAGKTAAGGK
ncbi:MAG TPA: 50S ribosomal protein L6 [Candidatus Avelusimicrobium excrementipullorum]|nr:50S ribosomal protein L6 [Candidatus Avelusimicrobium excrementipullorum]